MDKCPKCGEGGPPHGLTFKCGSSVRMSGGVTESTGCLRRQLAAANERAGRLEKALALLISDLDKCPTRQRGGASGQTVENNMAGTYITGLPAACVEQAREALEVRDDDE